MKTSKQIVNDFKEEFLIDDNILSKLKSVSLMMAKDLFASCKKRNIKIYIMFGTFLGAVRHKGFIPWDDDIDFCVYYDDYDKIIDAVKQDYPNKYYFTGCGKGEFEDPFYGIKMMLCGSLEIEASTTSYPYDRGIFIDIFPIIETYKSTFGRFLHKEKIRRLIHEGAFAFEYKYPPAFLHSKNKQIKKYYARRRFIGSFFYFRYNSIRKALYKTFAKKRNSGCFFVDGLLNSSPKFYISNNQLSHINSYKFEDTMFDGIADYDFVLKGLYGDNYMVIPPKEKQEKHPLVTIKFPD